MAADRWERFEHTAWAQVGHELDRLHSCISVTTKPHGDDGKPDSVPVLVEADIDGDIGFDIPCEVLAEALRARGYVVVIKDAAPDPMGAVRGVLVRETLDWERIEPDAEYARRIGESEHSEILALALSDIKRAVGG